MKMKGQVSTELLVVVGFIVLLFIPLVLFAYYKTGELNAGIEAMQSRLLSTKLAFIANALGSLGDDNSLKVELALPERVRSVQFRELGAGGEVLVTMDDGSEISQVTRFPFSSNESYAGGVDYKLEFVSKNRTIFVTQSG